MPGITETMLHHPDYFRCEKMACTLQKRVCVVRQDQALSFDDYMQGRKDQGKKIAYAMCADCAQGRRVRAETPGKDHSHVTPVRRIPIDPEPEEAITTTMEDTMKRDKCTNCQRDNLLICNAEGMCHSCHGASKNLTGDARITALDAARTRLQRKKPLPTAAADHVAPAPEAPASSVPAPGPALVPSASLRRILLDFAHDRDNELWSFINAEAIRCRRDPDQQVLWMLESHLTEHRVQEACA